MKNKNNIRKFSCGFLRKCHPRGSWNPERYVNNWILDHTPLGTGVQDDNGKSSQLGQALVTLLLFIVISVTLTTAAIIVIIVNTKSVAQIDQANFSRSIAESGIENALLRLLRNPGYTGETMTINGGTATVQVTSNGSSYTITSVGKIGFYLHTVQATATMNNNTITVSAWKEI